MGIADMHINFRQYALQMGMQNVGNLLPDQIDILINQSIEDKVNQLVRENVSVTNDKVIATNSNVGQINALRTLYDVKEVDITVGNNNNDLFIYNSQNRLQGLIKHLNQSGETDALFGDYMFLVAISINYIAEYPGTSIITQWYPVRIIDSAFLADTLNDSILRNNFKSPISCVYANDTLELFIDKFKEGDEAKVELRNGDLNLVLTPNKLRIDFIKYPAKVRYVGNEDQDNVDCNLPESMHGDIIKHAVDLYRVSVTGALYATRKEDDSK